MRVSEVMTREVQMAKPDQPICDAARLMAEIDAGVLPVSEGDRLVGMITDRDIAVGPWRSASRTPRRCAK